MKYYRVDGESGPRVLARDGEATYDLTSAKGEVTGFLDVARTAAITNRNVDAVADGLIADASEVGDPSSEDLVTPVIPDEVWAAGVTYRISEEAREAESEMPDMYREVYRGERPEIFFKATEAHTVGPAEDVGVRGDSDWDVPEPELGVVLYRGEIVGYTIGNDVSSRGIEGENPLYLPQAKIYDRCCSIGPCVTSAASVEDPHDLGMSMRISREDEIQFEGSTTTAEMVHTCENLVSYYTRHNVVPDLAVLLTGTAIVPQDSFTLRAGDEVEIDVDDIGTLRNGVCDV